MHENSPLSNEHSVESVFIQGNLDLLIEHGGFYNLRYKERKTYEEKSVVVEQYYFP